MAPIPRIVRPRGRSARSQAIVHSAVLAHFGLRFHSATAKQYCSSSSFVARHLTSRTASPPWASRLFRPVLVGVSISGTVRTAEHLAVSILQMAVFLRTSVLCRFTTESILPYATGAFRLAIR
jgi:hypothetical protein